MSARATAWAWAEIARRKELRPGEKLVLLRLADRADPAGVCWPGHERTASDVGMTRTSVREAVRLLKRRGLVRVEARIGEKGVALPNRYYLQIVGEGSESDPSPTQGARGAAPGQAVREGRGQIPTPRGQFEPSGEGSVQAPEEGSNSDPEAVNSNTKAAASNPHAAADLPRKRKQIHAETGVTYWYAGEIDLVLALVAAFGAAAVRQAAADLRAAGVDPLPTVVEARLASERREAQRTRTEHSRPPPARQAAVIASAEATLAEYESLRNTKS